MPMCSRFQVPCLIGAADSGKTSLFAPILGLVPPNSVARVSKQRNFNKAMITKDYEMIFLDEATVKIMETKPNQSEEKFPIKRLLRKKELELYENIDILNSKL